MKSGIYAIVNRLNGKVYVGSSKCLRLRKGSHWHTLRRGVHKNPHLQFAWLKYGEEAFEFWILEYVEVDLLGEREGFWILLLDSRNGDLGYNERDAPRPVHSEASRAKMSAYWTGRKRGPLSEETKSKIGAAHKGNQWTKGFKHSPEEIARRVAYWTGRPKSPEAIAKMAATKRGVPWSPARRAAYERQKGSVDEKTVARGITGSASDPGAT